VRGVSPAGATLSQAELMPPVHRELFHQLNNQLGIVLAYAELLESKAGDESQRARARQIVTSVLDALSTSKALQRQLGSSTDDHD